MRDISNIKILFKSKSLLMFTNVKNKKFTDISSGVVLTAIDQFENIVILTESNGNRRKVDVSKLLDNSNYDIYVDPVILDNSNDDYIDPATFFKSDKILDIFTEKIRSIPTDVLDQIKPDDNDVVSYTEEDPEEEKRIMQEKANQLYKNQADQSENARRKQNDLLKSLIDESDMPDIHIPVSDIVKESKVVESIPIVESKVIHSPINTTSHTDPIKQMFRNVKRNTEFSISIDIINKIPRIDFIEMMEDSYDVSIIDFLAEEFMQKILSNPDFIKDKIKNEIQNLVDNKKTDKHIIPNVTAGKLLDQVGGVPEKPKRVYKKKKENS